MDSVAEQTAVQQAIPHWFGDQPVTVQPLGAGHIHGTWLVTTQETTAPGTTDATGLGQRRYVLQRINQEVFARPDTVMANLLCVQRDMPATDLPAFSSAFPYALPAPIPARSGSYLVESGLQLLADGSQVPGQWRRRAFGEFQYWLGAQQGIEFAEVIPGFHELRRYLRALHQAAMNHEQLHSPDRGGVTRARTLFDALLSRDYAAITLEARDATQTLIHGDCKLNNLLFAADADQVVAVLDLDTMMQGPWWFDFGDLVRSATCSEAGEFNQVWYPALARGFFEGRAGVSDIRHQVRPAEGQLSAALQAPAYMTYMLAVRFLTDHLLGDQYFRVTQHGENLQRAEAQYRLLATLESSAIRSFMRGVLEELL